MAMALGYKIQDKYCIDIILISMKMVSCAPSWLPAGPPPQWCPWSAPPPAPALPPAPPHAPPPSPASPPGAAWSSPPPAHNLPIAHCDFTSETAHTQHSASPAPQLRPPSASGRFAERECVADWSSRWRVTNSDVKNILHNIRRRPILLHFHTKGLEAFSE